MSASRAAAVALAAAVAGGCWSGDALDPLPVPAPVPNVPTTTTVPGDHRDVPLAPVEGTTTTSAVVVGPGAAVLAGRVDGPDGPVAGATVLLERLVGGDAARLDVLTGADGTWRAPDVLGGRYRVRAWRQPDLAGSEPQLLFVAGTGTAELVLRVDPVAGGVVDLAVAPDPPAVAERTNVVVRVAERTVDADGVVRTVPRPGVIITLAAASGWVADSPLSALTDETGSATFTLVCQAPGEHGLLATVEPDQIVPLAPPECVQPPPPATETTVPPTGEG